MSTAKYLEKKTTHGYDLFISYSRRDNENNRITELKEQIEADYLQISGEPLGCFFDVETIHGMDDWRHRILQGLRDSQLLLLVLSPSYLASEYCEWEIVEYLKYEHSRAAAGQGVAPVYFVEVPGLDSPESNEQAAAWVAGVRRRNHFDLRPWNQEGAAALKNQEFANQLDDLERTLHSRISKLRRVTEAPGNLASHNPYFVGRETEMQRLHESAGLGRFGVLSAVQGVGGLGKTALAIQYAYAYADFYPGGRWIIPCANKQSLASAIRELGSDLAINFDEAEQRDDERAAKRVLAELEARTQSSVRSCSSGKNPTRPRALLLLDNVDAGDMLHPPQTELISGQRWLQIIATTRLSGEDFGYDPGSQTLLTVDELPIDNAVRLIESHQVEGRFPGEEERQAAVEIAEILGGFTLAVEVVANYLGEREGDVTCIDFVQRLRDEGFDRVAPGTKRGVSHGEKLISATLAPTLELLTPDESLVLSFAALLPPDLIPLPWVHVLAASEHAELGVEAEPGYDDPWLTLVNHLLGLRLLQVVDLEPDSCAPRLVRMHRLMAEVVLARNSGATNTRLKQLINHAVSRSKYLEGAWFEPTARWEVEPLIAFADLTVTSEHNMALRLVKSIGEWYVFTGDLRRNESLHRKALQILESQQPQDKLEISIFCSNLGHILHMKAQFHEAEGLLRRALEIDKRLRKPDSIVVAVRLNNLAGLLWSQGKLCEAEPLYREALVIRRIALPTGHTRIAESLNNLALLLQDQGKPIDAEPLQREALEIQRTKLPTGHPNIATSLNNLATLLWSQGKLGEAEPLYREALEIRRIALPTDHPQIAESLNNLALLLQDQGKPIDAVPLQREALEIQRTKLPTGHPNIATSLNNLATLLWSQGKLGEAEPLYREALETLRTSLPVGHHDIALSLNELAILLRVLKRFDESADMLRKAIKIEDKALSESHPKRPHRRNNLSIILMLEGTLNDAVSVNAEAWRLKASISDGGHDLTSGRILFTRIALSWLNGQATAVAIGQLKTLLGWEDLPCFGGIATRWNTTDILDELQSKLSSEQVNFLTAVVEALNNHARVGALEQFDIWKDQALVGLDKPWPNLS